MTKAAADCEMVCGNTPGVGADASTYSSLYGCNVREHASFSHDSFKEHPISDGSVAEQVNQSLGGIGKAQGNLPSI